MEEVNGKKAEITKKRLFGLGELILFVILTAVGILLSVGFTYKGTIINGDIIEFYYGHGVDSLIPVEEYKEARQNATHCWGTVGTGEMVAYPDSGTNYGLNDGPWLTYEIHFPATGTYYLWVKGTTGNPASDSIHYGIDGSLTGAITFLYGEWSNTKQTGGRATVNVTAIGPHLLNIWMREDGTTIKNIIVTQNASFQPT